MRDTPYFSWRDHPQTFWTPTRNQDFNVFENSSIKGLYFVNGLLTIESLEAIMHIINWSCGHPVSSKSRACEDNVVGLSFPWYQYDPCRYIAGCLPYSKNNGTESESGDGMDRNLLMKSLCNFEVFGNRNPANWLDLNVMSQCAVAAVDDPLRRQGVDSLVDMQYTIPKLLPVSSLQFNPYLKCTFLQFQYMERGVSIGAHVDSDDPLVDVIVTACIRGSNIIRVGNIDVCIKEGDVYVLTDYARHCVKHEVLSSTEDRVTVTLRYTHTDPRYREELKHNLPWNVPL